MSRTYRRKNQEQAFWQVNYYRAQFRDTEDYSNQRYFKRIGVPKNKDPFEVWLKKKFHSDKWFSMKNPGWWNKMWSTTPLRARTRQNIHKVMKLHDLEDAPVFDEKVPIVYYW